MSVFSMFVMSSIPLGNMFYGFLVNTLPVHICIIISSIAVFITYPMIIYMTKE